MNKKHIVTITDCIDIAANELRANMISVEEALEKILSYIKVLDGIETPILECLDQVLDQDMYSSIDIPPSDNSAMDGYAVKAANIA